MKISVQNSMEKKKSKSLIFKDMTSLRSTFRVKII